MLDLRNAADRYFRFFNERRYHQSREYKTPDEIYGRPFSMASGLKEVA
jgi:putative transposase